MPTASGAMGSPSVLVYGTNQMFSPISATDAYTVQLTNSIPLDYGINNPTLWREAFDAATARPYYFHIVTKQTQWIKPIELQFLDQV